MSKPSKFAQPFPEYEILERLGSGGMGTVFKARRKTDDAMVALKVLRPSLSRNARYVERLRREAEISMRLDHPGLVKGFGLGEEGGYHYLVMEYVEGRSLKALLKTWGRFPEEQVLDVGIQMAEALAYAHESGVIHRDVKPGNIIVDDDDRAKLTDLGLAKGESDPTLTRDGATVGTPQYMSPEQAQDPARVDERSDLYSLGATMYHMAVGLPPFEGESVVQVISKLLNERADSAGSLNPEVSTGVNLILRRLLTKDPDLRYATAVDLLVDLRKVQAGQPPAVDVKALARAEGTSRKGVGPLHVAVGAAAAIGVGVLLWAFTRPGEPEKPRLLQDLRQAVADARSGFKHRLGLIDRFEATEQERVAVGELRQSVLREFRGALMQFQKRFSLEGVDRWVAAQPLTGATPDRYEAHVAAALQRHEAFHGFTVATLPDGIDDLYTPWIGERLARVASARESRVVAALREIRDGYANVVKPAIERRRAERRFAEVDAYVARLAKRPWECNGDTTPPRLAKEELGRLADLRAELERTRATILAEVRDLTSEWQAGVTNAIDQAEKFAEQDLPAKARASLAAARRLLAGKRPWATLPEGIEVRTGRLSSRIATVAGVIADTDRRRDFKALAECEDTVHRVLGRDLNVDKAERLVANYDFVDPDASRERKALLGDLTELRRAIDWLLAAAKDASGRFELREGRIDGAVSRVVGGPVPTLFVRSGGKERELPLARFDVAALVERFETAPGAGAHGLGRGLLLFFQDRFGAASEYLQNHRGARYRAMRERRHVFLDWLGQKTETQAARLLDKLDTLIERRETAFRQLRLAASLLEELEADYARTQAVRGARSQLARYHELIELERERRALLGRLRADVREAAALTVKQEGDGFSVRLRFAFAAGASPNGLGGWTASPGGLTPPDGAAGELAKPLLVPLPIVDPSSEVTVRLKLAIPAGASVDVIVLEVLGSRFMLSQIGELPGTVQTEIGRDPRKSLKRAWARATRVAADRASGKDKSKPWFFVPGGRYDIELRFGTAQNLQRSCALSLNGAALELDNSRVRAPGQPKPELQVGGVGRFVLAELVIDAKARR